MSTTTIQPDKPHPLSYRPDLPLTVMGREEDAEAREEFYDEGFEDGYESRGRNDAARLRTLETENATLRAKLDPAA